MHDEKNQMACYYDSVTDTAFGPIFNDLDCHGLDAREVMEIILPKFKDDPRVLDYEDIDAVRFLVYECENSADDVKMCEAAVRKEKLSRIRSARAVVDLIEAKSRAALAAKTCPVCIAQSEEESSS